MFQISLRILRKLGFTQNVEFIGHGKKSCVFKVIDENGQVFGLKMFKESDADMHEWKSTQTIRECKCPYLLEHISKETGGGYVYVQLEFANNKSLKEELDKGMFGVSEFSKRIIYQILVGINTLHSCQIIHKDIKSSSILLHKDEKTNEIVVKIGNFIRFDTGGASIDMALHLAPEILKGEEFDSAADLWSLGLLFFQIASNNKAQAYTASSVAELLEQLKSPPVRSEVFNEHDDWWQMIEGMLAYRPDKRLTTSQLVNLPLFDSIRGSFPLSNYAPSANAAFVAPPPLSVARNSRDFLPASIPANHPHFQHQHHGSSDSSAVSPSSTSPPLPVTSGKPPSSSSLSSNTHSPSPPASPCPSSPSSSTAPSPSTGPYVGAGAIPRSFFLGPSNQGGLNNLFSRLGVKETSTPGGAVTGASTGGGSGGGGENNAKVKNTKGKEEKNDGNKKNTKGKGGGVGIEDEDWVSVQSSNMLEGGVFLSTGGVGAERLSSFLPNPYGDYARSGVNFTFSGQPRTVFLRKVLDAGIWRFSVVVNKFFQSSFRIGIGHPDAVEAGVMANELGGTGDCGTAGYNLSTEIESVVGSDGSTPYNTEAAVVDGLMVSIEVNVDRRTLFFFKNDRVVLCYLTNIPHPLHVGFSASADYTVRCMNITQKFADTIAKPGNDFLAVKWVYPKGKKCTVM